MREDEPDSAVGRLSAGSGRRPSAAHEIRALGGNALFRGKDVLEIGTGEGRLALGYAAVARTVLAVDPDPAAIAIAVAGARSRDLVNVRFVVGAAQALDVGRERFDLAVLAWVL